MKLFFDLEFTCNQTSLITDWNDPDFPPEIIEIGLLVYSRDKIINSKEFAVKPKINPELTEYCLKLTNISQKRINEAKSLAEVNAQIVEWISKYPVSEFYSWGVEDLVFWENDSLKQNSACPINVKKYIDLMRSASNKLFQNNAVINRKIVREHLNLPDNNNHKHNAISDAYDLISLYKAITSFHNE